MNSFKLAINRYITILSLKKQRFLARHSKKQRKTSGFMRRTLEFIGISLIYTLIKVHAFLWIIFSPIISFSSKYIINPISDFIYAIHNIPRSRSAVVLSVSVICMVIWSASIFNVALEVSVDGQSIGFVRNSNDIEQAVSLIEEQTSSILGVPYTFGTNISYELKPVTEKNLISKGDTILSPKEMSRYLSSHVDAVSSLAVVRIDGEVIGAVKSPIESKMVLDKIASKYTGGDNSVKYDFMENVEVDVIDTTADIAMTSDDLYNSLTSSEETDQIYTVRGNETMSSIAQKYDMNTSELLSMNPSVTPTRMRAGDKITISKPQAKLSVVTYKDVNYNETIPYTTKKNTNSTLPKNQTKTITKGINGNASISAKIKYVNGVENEKIINSRTVLSQPKQEVLEVGTRNISQGTGTMMRPFGGKVTSNYGYRGREFHTGVDLAGSSGSAIKAADSGKVTFSGWNGNYGYCVIINHGNGKETIYAHNSKNLVKVGDSVDKGTIIGKVGSTGRSTGPHVHFEVRINGKHVNPRNYIKY